MKVKNQYLKILEYLHLSFNKWPSIQYKLWVSLVLWKHNNGEHCWLGNGPEDDHCKSQRVITERGGGGCSRSAVSKHIKCKVDWKEEIGKENVHKQQGWPQAWKYCQAKPIQTLGRASQGLNWSWSQCIKSHHTQTSSGKELPSHFWNRNIVRNILPGLRRRRTGLLQSLEEERRDTESMLLEVQCEVSTVGDDLGCHVICWCWSTVFSEVHSQHSIYQDIIEHFMLPSADAVLIFQQDLAPAHTAKGTKSWFNDHVLLCLIGQQTLLTWTS